MTAGALLLDVNVLLALGWAEHVGHSAVVRRLSGRSAPAWATCPITQLGFVRISSTSGVFKQTLSPQQAHAALATLCTDDRHQIVADHPSVLDCDFSRLTGPRQTTDAYLLALAQRHSLTLLTLDQRISAAFPGTPLELLTA